MLQQIENITDKKGTILSVLPCQHYLTFGQWIYLVPQYDPDSVLILGYAGGTVAGLIRLFYGDTPITGVDVNPLPRGAYEPDVFELKNAESYIKTAPFFDTIIVDIFEDGQTKPPEFVASKQFKNYVCERCNYLIIHTDRSTDMHNYEDLHLVKMLSYDNSRFYYYMINRIARLPIR